MFGSGVGGAEVLLTLQDAGFNNGLTQAEARLQRFSGSAGQSMGGFQKVAAGAFIAVGAAAVVGLAKAIRAASDLGESVNKSKVIFGAAADSVEKFATSAEKIGLSKQLALDAAAGFGAMAQSAGLSESASADLSISMVKLAADMASFNNQDPAEMLERLRSGLAGEAEPLRKFGVFISEARVQTEAYASGIAKAGTALTDAQKIQARYNIILKDTTKQSGDFARTVGDSIPNKVRQASASIQNLAASLGTGLLPFVKLAVTAFQALVPVLEPLIRNLVVVAGGFLAFKAITFLPGLLLSIAVGMERIGAVKLANSLLNIAGGLEGLAGPLGVAVIGATAFTYALVQANRAATEQQQRLLGDIQAVKDFGTNTKAGADAQRDFGAGIKENYGRLGGFNARVTELDAAMVAATGSQHAATVAIREAVVALKAEEDQSRRTKDAILEQRAATDQLAGGLLGLVSSARSARDANAALADAQRKVTEDLKKGKEGTKEYAKDLRTLRDAELAALQGNLSFHAALTSYAQTLRGPVAKAHENLIKAINKQTSATYTAEQKTRDIAAATQALTAAQHGLAPAQQKAIALLRDMGAKAGLTKGQVDKLIGSILKQAGAIDGVTNAWGRVPKKITTDYFIIQHGYIPGGGGAGNYYGKSARGGTFRGYEGGATFMGPGGPFRAGEGGYMTPAGTGAEIVGQNGIMPLDMGTFDKIGHSLAKYIGSAGGGNHYHFHGPVYGFDDFRQKVAQAERANNRERMPL